MPKRFTMSKTGADSWRYRGWYIERGFRVYFAGKLLMDRTLEFKANSMKNARNVIDDYEETGELNISPGGYGTSEKDPPLGQYRGQDIERGYKGWNIEKKEFSGVRGGTILAYEATKGDQIHRHEKLKIVKTIIDDIERGSNPMATKKKAKRKATPAQLRALKKAHAALKKKRALKKKAPKRTRRNPAYGNYSKARSVARGSRGVNPVRKLAPVYAISSGGKYFNGIRFSGTVETAARFKTLKHVSRVAHILADDYKKPVKIVDLRK